MNVSRRGFLALGALCVAPVSWAEPGNTLRVTPGLLREWGACDRAVVLYGERYPDGVEGTAAEIAAIAEAEYDAAWILEELAARCADQVGEDALRLLIEKADPSRLANVVLRVKDKDTQSALDKLLVSNDLMQIKRVADGGDGDAQALAVSALESKGVI